MKRFINIQQKDKKDIKMINQSETGFELVVTSDKVLNDLSKMIKSCNSENVEIYLVWQMKFKASNNVLYKKCIFSEPVDNYFTDSRNMNVLLGKKFMVKCSGISYYSDSFIYKNRIVKKSHDIYKDGILLDRMIKIGELDYKSTLY